MQNDELIARLEAATGPCRELDAAIALAVDGGEIVWKMANYTMESYPARRYASADHVGGYGNAPVPTYTASIDAALTLVPEGALWGVGNEDCTDRPWAWCLPPGRSWDDADNSYAPTPALAICIAALKARP